MPSVDVLLEEGRRRTFACALDWPGWARSGRDRAAALEALEAYRDRFGAIIEAAGLEAPTGRIRVTETVEGDAGTDFGAPMRVGEADRRSMRPPARARSAAILRATWDAFEGAAAPRPALRSGPRGGGRTAEQLWGHVADAEVAYARGLGLSVRATGQDPVLVEALRGELVALVLGARGPDREPRWPLRYGVRRIAWHALDHLFELEDRREGPGPGPSGDRSDRRLC